MRRLLWSGTPVDLSIVEFDLDAGEEVFLTYTWERWEGPGIERRGPMPPYMDLIGGSPGQTTTHPFGLRLGTWLIQERFRDSEREEAEKELATARQRNAPSEDLWVLGETVKELRTIRAHDRVFQDLYREYDVIAHQGCGDLSMNAWNVAFLSGPLAHDPKQQNRDPILVCLPREPLEYRTYSALIKWKPRPYCRARMTIEEVRFHRRGQVRDVNEMVWVLAGDRWLPRGDLIEFAVSNQQVVRNGELVPIVTVSRQFGDLRHLLQMPTLNPMGPLYPGEPRHTNGVYRPRQYYGEEQDQDVWLGERDLLEDTSENLVRAALAGPVLLPFPAGADRERLRGALGQAGYKEVATALQPLAAGQWRFVRLRPEVTRLEIYYKRNTYGWTMLGLGAENRHVVSLACTGLPGRTGYVLEQAAQFLLQAGGRNALLIDEGADVFQQLKERPDGMLEDQVRRLRGRLRATFILGQRREAPQAEKRV